MMVFGIRVSQTQQSRQSRNSRMASALASKRLRKEYLAIKKSPLENIEAIPLESNILHWHYVITGTKDTPFSGGYYHGILKFPKEYPMKPPSILMFTPNGRFSINCRLCLSMSDFHPGTYCCSRMVV